jgi:hypothetical protein
MYSFLSNPEKAMQSSKEIMAFSNVPFARSTVTALVKATVTASSQFRAHLASSHHQVFPGM